MSHPDHPDVLGAPPNILAAALPVASRSKFDEYGLPIGLAVKRRQIGVWDFLTSGQPVHMTGGELESLSSVIAHWRESFAGGVKKTLIQRRFGAHSAIIRLDYFWKDRLGVQLCEVEERPAGLYATSLVNNQFREPLIRILRGIEHAFGKKLAFCVSGGRGNDSDDQDLVRLFSWGKQGGFTPKDIPYFNGIPSIEDAERYVWWVRALRSEKQYFDLEPYAVTTISQEGDKEYGLRMGKWFEIGADWRQVLPLEAGVVLKPRSGSRFEHSLIIQMKGRSALARKEGLDGGMHGEKDARTAIESGSVVYWQPFYPPEEPKFLGDSGYRMMRRAYFGFDFESDKYVPMGGMWFAHNSSRIHGAKDALAGPLRLSL